MKYDGDDKIKQAKFTDNRSLLPVTWYFQYLILFSTHYLPSTWARHDKLLGTIKNTLGLVLRQDPFI